MFAWAEPASRAAGPSCGRRHRAEPASSSWILALASVIMAMGLCRRSQEPRLAAPAGDPVRAAPTVLAASGVRVTLFGPFTHPLLGGAVTVLWIVGLTNAFNMLDNMDGLAASVGLIAALLFCGAQVAVGQPVRAGGSAGGGGGLGGVSGAQPLAGAAVHG